MFWRGTRLSFSSLKLHRFDRCEAISKAWGHLRAAWLRRWERFPSSPTAYPSRASSMSFTAVKTVTREGRYREEPMLDRARSSANGRVAHC